MHACLQEVLRAAYLSSLAQDTIAEGIAKEPSHSSFREPPTADLLQNLPVGSRGSSHRTAPCVVAARVAGVHLFRRSLAAYEPGAQLAACVRACVCSSRPVLLCALSLSALW